MRLEGRGRPRCCYIRAASCFPPPLAVRATAGWQARRSATGAKAGETPRIAAKCTQAAPAMARLLGMRQGESVGAALPPSPTLRRRHLAK